jgi:hypothetical protein
VRAVNLGRVNDTSDGAADGHAKLRAGIPAKERAYRAANDGSNLLAAHRYTSTIRLRHTSSSRISTTARSPA